MEFNIILNVQDIQVLDATLGARPYRQVAPLIAKINKQVNDQQTTMLNKNSRGENGDTN